MGLLPPRTDVAWEKLVLSLKAAPASLGAGLQLQASWGQAAGGVGVLCPVCSLVSLTCFGSGVSALWPNPFLPFRSNLIPEVINLLRSLLAVVDEIKLIKSREALSMYH